jgi:hypothetical protein
MGELWQIAYDKAIAAEKARLAYEQALREAFEASDRARGLIP